MTDAADKTEIEMTLPVKEIVIEMAAQRLDEIEMRKEEIKSDISVDESDSNDNDVIFTSLPIEADNPEREIDENKSELSNVESEIPSERVDVGTPAQEVDQKNETDDDSRKIGIPEVPEVQVDLDDPRSLAADLEEILNLIFETEDKDLEGDSRILGIK